MYYFKNKCCREWNDKFYITKFIDIDNNRKIDFFKNSINEKIELKISGGNISEFYQSIKERYLDKTLFYIEIEMKPNLLRFWDYVELDSGQNDMRDLEYEKIEYCHFSNSTSNPNS